MMQGYNFTERVRKVLSLARDEAADLDSDAVATEHILLAVIREGHGTASSVITNFGVNGQALRSRVMELAPPGKTKTQSATDVPYSSRAKRALELAMTEARELNHSYVGTEHLLLGLLHEGKGPAARALNSMGITLEPAREETLRVLVGAGGHLSARRHAHVASDSLAPYPQRLREVMSDAYEIAAERGSVEVTPAHAMIALIEHRDGVANTALDRLRVDRSEVLFALNDLAPQGERSVPPDAMLNPSPALANALGAMQSAQRDSHAPVPGTQHLLLGVLATSPEITAVFDALGLTEDVVREEIRRGTG